MDYNFSVKEAVWLAAAVHAYTKAKEGHTRIEDFCMPASELRNLAGTYTQNEVQEPRIRQWFNADHPQNSNNYLREVLVNGKKYYRVTAIGELLGNKEYPDSIDWPDEIEFEGVSYSLNEIKTFLEGEYRQFIWEGEQLYTIEQIRERLTELGYSLNNIASNMTQLGNKMSTIHSTKDSIIIYSTDDDYNQIVNEESLQGLIKNFHPNTREEMQASIERESDNKLAVLCFDNGNKLLHPTSASNYNRNEIHVCANDSFRKVFKAITGADFLSSGTSQARWLIAANPSKYDVMSAFAELVKVDWRQTFNANVGDIVYIYVSDSVKEIRFKCRINKTELSELEIEDSQFNVSDEFDGSYDRYMELEPIKQYSGPAYGRDELMKHGFKSPLGPMRVPAELQAYLDSLENTVDIDYVGLLEYLKNNQEKPCIKPNPSNATSEEIIEYEQIEQKGLWAAGELRKIADKCNKLFSIDMYDGGTWLDGSETKTGRYLCIQLKYKDYFDSPISISIFVEKEDSQTRYRISLDLKNEGIKKEIYEQYHSHLDLSLSDGMTYATRLNEWGNPTITTESADVLKAKVESGVERKVQICIYSVPDDHKTNKQFDEEVMAAVEQLIPYYKYVLGMDKDDEWWPSLDEYDPGLSVDDWVRILNDKDIFNQEKLSMLSKMLKIGGVATCSKLAETFGSTSGLYRNIGQDIGRLINIKYDVSFFMDGETSRMFVIPFMGKHVKEDGKQRYAWKIREPLKEALSMIDLVEDTTMNQNENYDLNMILYGPPGTGKTYNSATYAVAICDGKKVEELKDYSYVMKRYAELKSEGRIAFTTFHQSYGYEEFIEGIKPVLQENEENAIGYKIESGIFKQFCIDNSKQNIEDDNEIGFVKENPNIWGMLLGGTGTTAIKQECFENGEVRLGFDEVDDLDIQGEYFDDEKSSYQAKKMVDYFINSVEIGDIIVTEKTNKSIDAIGVVTGDYTRDETRAGNYARTRLVKWLTTDLDQDITEFLPKGRVNMARKSIFPFDYIGIETISKILDMNDVDYSFSLARDNKPCVFIIDEINRGNISKIFGELITLIEDTKRAGKPEAASAILPYSNTEFSVPSNVYILGTMNTADRSIQLMDTALRRRFKFIEKMPNANVLRNMGINDVDFGGTTINIPRMLEAINERIAYLYDREHTIGHAFFTGLKEEPTIEKLATIFEKSVIPLLQEYFYEDYQKIQLVLGDNAKTDDNLKFVKNTPVKLKELFMGSVEDIVDEQEVKYEINHSAFKNIEAYKTIARDL